MKLDAFVQNLPKAELCVHLEGTLEPELVMQLAARKNILLPFQTLADAREAYRFKDLPTFLDLYYKALTVLITEEDFYDVTWHYLQKAHSQHVRHLEICFDPQAHLARGVKFESMITGIHRALQDGESKLHLSSHLIMCFLRDLPEEAALEVFTQALPFKDWVVAIGLDSKEKNNPPSKFANLFERARDQGFLTVAIAGEEGPPDYIWETLDVLKVARIDHGVMCVEDPDLMAKLAATQIPINMCPVSNVKLGVVPHMRHHPLKRMHDEGLFVTVNSDDPAYFGASLNDNYLAVASALKLNKQLLYEFAKNSFNASFLEHDKKEKLLMELEKYYKQACKESG